MYTQIKRPRVFCCLDENNDTCKRLTEVLNSCGATYCCVISARDICSALWWAKSERFDLYILGRSFADGTGLELCRKLREFDPHTPIFFYAEDADDSERRLEGLAAGAQAYLVKPDVDELAATVLRLLDHKGRIAA
jgi:DNA-binding response OmpR family regulator